MIIKDSKLRKIIREEITRSLKMKKESHEQKLTPEQDMQAWDLGYQLASSHHTKGINDPYSAFIVANRMGIPNESHPLFLPVVSTAEEAYKAFMASTVTPE